MKFRAVSDTQAVQDRPGIIKAPVQAFGDCINRMREWAQKAADQTGTVVHIYKLNEELAETVEPEALVAARKTGGWKEQ
jgi:hypothetical protein